MTGLTIAFALAGCQSAPQEAQAADPSEIDQAVAQAEMQKEAAKRRTAPSSAATGQENAPST